MSTPVHRWRRGRLRAASPRDGPCDVRSSARRPGRSWIDCRTPRAARWTTAQRASGTIQPSTSGGLMRVRLGLLAIATALTLTACGGSGTTADTTDDVTATETTAAATAADFNE